MLNFTVFRQVQQLYSRYDFDKCSKKYFSGRKREMTPWRLFQTILLSQLSNCSSLRDIAMLLTAHKEKNYHHGMKAFGKSTIARASEHFDYKIYADFAEMLLKSCQRKAPRNGFRFNNKLYSVDSTTIPLCLSLFSWAHFRQRKGGVKIHTQLDHDGGLPTILNITVAKSSDSTQSRLVQAEKHDIVVFDRGYNSYKWFKALDTKGVFFVTRMKEGASYTVLERCKVTKGKGIIRDQIICLNNQKNSMKLRLVVYVDEVTKKQYTYLTNNRKLAARTIADIYKDRWRIETFFKDIKQNLKIKTFMGTSENAVKTQIYIAICAYLLLKLLRLSEGITQSIGLIRKVLATALFTSKSLQELFRRQTQNNNHPTQQLTLTVL